jgi:hypothetical protein
MYQQQQQQQRLIAVAVVPLVVALTVGLNGQTVLAWGGGGGYYQPACYSDCQPTPCVNPYPSWGYGCCSCGGYGWHGPIGPPVQQGWSGQGQEQTQGATINQYGNGNYASINNAQGINLGTILRDLDHAWHDGENTLAGNGY